jgi:hypothetical protein
MAVREGIYGEIKCREVHRHPHFKSPQKTATRLFEVCVKAVEWNCQTWHMQKIANENPLTINRYDSCAMPQNRWVRVVTHPNLEVGDGLVQYEG